MKGCRAILALDVFKLRLSVEEGGTEANLNKITLVGSLLVP
jgi:hypothetical protein